MNFFTKILVTPITMFFSVVIFFIFLGCCAAAVYQRVTR